MIIHGARPSPFARKVIAACEEKGIPYQEQSLAPIPKTPELLAKHPMGKIPILELDDGTFIPDSSVICAYLERVHPRNPIYPSDPVDYAQALFVEEYADTKVVEVVGGIAFERFIKPMAFQQDPDKERVESLMQNELPPVFDYLESRVPDRGDAIFGSFGIADLALGAHLGGLRLAKLEIDASRWPKLAAYTQAVLARPSFQKVMQMNLG